MNDTQHVSGLRELHEALQKLPVEVEKKILRGALRAAAVPFKDAAYNNAPIDDGDLKESIRITTSVRKGVAKATVKAGGRKAPHAAWVEYGTGEHLIDNLDKKALSFGGGVVSEVIHPGAKAHPFMRPAFEDPQARSSAIEAFVEYVRKRLAKEALKNGR